jgi:hypothetical protein
MNFNDWQPAAMFIFAVLLLAVGLISIVRRWNGRR